MFTGISGRRLVLAASLALTADRAIAQASVYSERPPAAVVDALYDLASPSDARRAAAAKRLKAEESWEPYLRSALNATRRQQDRDRLRPILASCQSRLLAWNLTRIKGWADELHFDYLTDLAAATDDEKVAATIAGEVIRAQQTVLKRYINVWEKTKYGGNKYHLFLLKKDYQSLSAMDGFRRFSGDYVRIPNEHGVKPAFVHARSGRVESRSRSWINLTSQQFDETDESIKLGWTFSVVCVNSDFVLRQASNSLIICDGNVDLISQGGFPPSASGSAIIANGDVNAYEDSRLASTFFYAAGDFSGPKIEFHSSTSVVTGGKNPLIPPKDDPRYSFYRQSVKDNPLGIKFISPADVGVELAVGVKVVRLAAVKPDSPIAKAGLQKGDRFIKLNGVPMETAADFRRQLRESLLWGTGLFEVKRGDQTFLRLVKFAEPPKK